MAEHLSGSKCAKAYDRDASSPLFFFIAVNITKKNFVEDSLVVKDIVSIATNAACEEGRESPGLGSVVEYTVHRRRGNRLAIEG